MNYFEMKWRLSACRIQAGYSQAEVAEILGCSDKTNSGDIAEIDKVLANIDEEVSRYVDGNEKLKVEYLLEHLEQVQIFPDKVIVIVPILSEGIVVEKTQYVSREKRCR